jgi:hypothetical protein
MRCGRCAVIMMMLSLVVSTLSTPPARADEGAEAALRQQLDALRRQLDALQLKLDRIRTENAAAPASPAAPVAAPAAAAPKVPDASAPTPVAPAEVAPATAVPAAATPPVPARVEAAIAPASPAVPEAFQWRETLKEQWRGVRAGMNGEQIRQLLGAPTREFALDGKPVWYYSYPGIGNGSVLFGRDGGAVVGWQHPPFGFW